MDEAVVAAKFGQLRLGIPGVPLLEAVKYQYIFPNNTQKQLLPVLLT